jgi:hypothetical protein
MHEPLANSGFIDSSAPAGWAVLLSLREGKVNALGSKTRLHRLIQA